MESTPASSNGVLRSRLVPSANGETLKVNGSATLKPEVLQRDGGRSNDSRYVSYVSFVLMLIGNSTAVEVHQHQKMLFHLSNPSNMLAKSEDGDYSLQLTTRTEFPILTPIQVTGISEVSSPCFG